MPWFRVDDGFWSHPKTLQLSDGAQALWMRAGSWSMHHLTDGLIPAFALQLLGAKPRFVSELVAVSLWIPDEGAYRFHDWSRYQPTRSQVEADRDAAAERKRRSREKSRRDSTVTDGAGSADAAPSPSHPTPSHPTPPNGGEDVADRADISELCELLADLVEENGSKRPAVTKAWRDSARLLLDRDGRELDAAKRLVRWTQGDSFWRSNVLSMPTFRKQYDRLRLAANRQLEERKQSSTRAGGRDQRVFDFITADQHDTPREISA